MKIKRVEFQNHPILGNLPFDFAVEGSVRDFALLVAENGCGKTILLEEIHKILSGGFALWNDGVSRKITIEFTEQEQTDLELPTGTIVFDYDETRSTTNNWSRFLVFDTDGVDISNVVRPKFQNESPLNKVLKCAYSTVEINFNKREIEAIKATTIDSEDSTKNKSSTELATEIAQLLVDIKNQDNAEKATHFDSGHSNADVQYQGKFDRFKAAYAKMFDGKELLDVRVNNNKYQVLFKDIKKNVEFDISGLSSGEKQVVYRVGYLLRSLRGLNGGIALIDEPELSLHPKWQEKYLQFLREVFFVGTGVNMQFIIATHSPLMLKGALDGDVSVHILRKDDVGAVSVTNAQEKGFGLLKWSPSWGEICYFAYGLPTVEFHDDLYSTIEDGLKTSPTQRVSQEDVESWLIDVSRGAHQQTREIRWTDPAGGQKEETLMTYVRNRVHHPDNQGRPTHTREQLCESIRRMIEILKTP